MVNNIEPLFVSINDGAKILGLGRSKFYEEAKKGNIQLVRMGKRSLVSVASLKAFADSLIQEASA